MLENTCSHIKNIIINNIIIKNCQHHNEKIVWKIKHAKRQLGKTQKKIDLL